MSAKDRRKATVAARLTATGTVWTLAEVLAEVSARRGRRRPEAAKQPGEQ